MTDTQIASLALSLIGAQGLSSLSGDSTPQAVECRRWFSVARDELLGSHPWNCAAKRDRLTTSYTDLSGIALAASGDGEIAVDAASHGLTTGQRIYMKDVQGVTAANGRWHVTVIDPDTFVLDDSTFSGTHTSGTGSWALVPLFGWDFWHDAPADCLKVRRVLCSGDRDTEAQTSEPHRVEGGKILSGLETVYLYYTFQNTDTTTWEAEFITAFSYLLASYVASTLAGYNGRSGEMREIFEKLMLPNAEVRDSREGIAETPPISAYDSPLAASRFAY